MRVSALPRVVLLAGLLPATLIYAQSALLSADTDTDAGFPNSNYGSQPDLALGHGSSVYIKFDLSGLPAGAKVDKAMLRLFANKVIGSSVVKVYLAGAQ